MGKKTYISLGANPLSLDIAIGGKLHSVDFTGGLKNPIVILPKFMTENVELQKALEAYPVYGTAFEIYKDETDPGEAEALKSVEAPVIVVESPVEEAPVLIPLVEEAPVIEAPEEVKEATQETEMVPQLETPVEPETVKFATVTEAKQWLNTKKNVPFNRITSKEKVLQVCADLGITISIDNE